MTAHVHDLLHAASPSIGVTRERHEVPDAYKWRLSDIFPDWESWEAACRDLEAAIDQLPALQGTLGRGPERLLAALRASDALGQLAYKVYYYSALMHDEDQRSNEVNARKQQVQVAPRALGPGDVVVQPRTAADPGRDRARVDGRPRRPRRVPLRARRPLPAAGARARRGRRAAAVAGQPLREHAARGLRGAVDGRHQVADDHAEQRRSGPGHLRAVPGDARHQPRAGRSRVGVPRAARDLRAERQHLRRALQRRPAARSRSARRRGTIKPRSTRALFGNNIPHVGRREPHRDDAGARRADAAVRALPQARARARDLPRLRRVDPDRRRRPAVCLRRGPRVDRRVGGAAGRGLPAARPRRVRRAVDRRVREPGQAQRRVLGARLRRPPVHAAQLERDAGRGVHARARDGPLDAHAATRTSPSRSCTRATPSSWPRCRPR